MRLWSLQSFLVSWAASSAIAEIQTSQEQRKNPIEDYLRSIDMKPVHVRQTTCYPLPTSRSTCVLDL